MPRTKRTDIPGIYQHVYARGIERSDIFRGDEDAQTFLERLEKLTGDTGTEIHAFALLPNHFHLLLRRHSTTISTFMQRLLTGHAVHFNKKYGRVGHLFQNRYKAIACFSESYRLELIRYIHLNPLRAGVVGSLRELAGYRFSGHAYVLGNLQSRWFDPAWVLAQFGVTRDQARKKYIDFLAAALPENAGTIFDEILTGEDAADSRAFFEERTMRFADSPDHMGYDGGASSFEEIAAQVCWAFSLADEDLFSGMKKRDFVRARALLACRCSRELGLSGSEIARRLSVSRSAVSKMISRGCGMDGTPSLPSNQKAEAGATLNRRMESRPHPCEARADAPRGSGSGQS